MANQDTEFTLGIGKLLGLFFGLVVLCGGFFVMGYSLGKNATPTSTLLTDTSVPAATPATTTTKPGASQAVVAPKHDCVSTPEGCAAAAVNPTQVSEVNAPVATPQAAASPVAEPKPASTAPEVARPAILNGNSYVVQVAAVSKQQDAEALVAALRKKQYQVFIASQTADSLFHVQIGPFGDPKEADSVKARLVADGYNPIVKR